MDSDVRRKKKKNLTDPASSSSQDSFFSREPFFISVPHSKSDFSKLIAVISIAAVVAVSCNFIINSLDRPVKPFCDSDVSSRADDIFIYDDCEPCPVNGVCTNGQMTCDYGYKKQGKLCVEDGDVAKAAKHLLKFVEVQLCEAYAQLLCSGTGRSWVSDAELWNNLREYKTIDSHSLDETIYVPAKQKAIETMRIVLETRRDNQSVEEFKCPELLVSHYKSISCCIRLWLINHISVLVPAVSLFMGFVLVAYKAYRRHKLTVRAEQLYHEVCDILEEKSLASKGVNGGGEPWVIASSLRDHLLSTKERKDPILWRKVVELVQEDSRVDQYPMLVKGESKVVWEWQVEGSVNSSGKRRKNVENAKESKESIRSSSKVQGFKLAGELFTCVLLFHLLHGMVKF